MAKEASVVSLHTTYTTTTVVISIITSVTVKDADSRTVTIVIASVDPQNPQSEKGLAYQAAHTHRTKEKIADRPSRSHNISINPDNNINVDSNSISGSHDFNCSSNNSIPNHTHNHNGDPAEREGRSLLPTTRPQSAVNSQSQWQNF